MLTLKYRIKSGDRRLIRMAKACNQVWNFCVETQKAAERKRSGGSNVFWPNAFDLIKLVTGAAADLGIHSDTASQICRQFVASRDARRKCPRFRASFGSKRALGWIPFIPRAVKIEGACAIYLKQRYSLWLSREIKGDFKAGTFVEDARGRWYATFQCEVADDLATGNGKIGIDLGLKDFATLSDGTKIPALRHYRKYEAQLATAQRAGNKRRARAIHAKIANVRKHHLHEQSTAIVRANKYIAVGNVSAAKLAKTRMAKSVLDASWSSFRHMLRYKARRHGAVCVDVDERWTSQTCSSCGSIPASSPKGMGALGVRHWECSECGALHDRDVNASLNILRVGLEHQPPAEEIRAA